MKKFATKLTLPLLLIFSLSIALTSCGGGGGSSGSGQEGDGLSTINGRVADVVMSMAPTGKEYYMLAMLKDFFTISKSVGAQATPVGDISVIALDDDGIELDDTVTGPDGSFQLGVSGGDITLVFVTPDFQVSTTIVVPADGTVNIIVILQPGQVSQVGFEGDIEVEFTGIITEINCPLITVNGTTIVDTSFAEIEGDDDNDDNGDDNGNDDTDLTCQQLLIGDSVEVEGILDQASGIVIAEEVEVDFDGDDDNGDDDNGDDDNGDDDNDNGDDDNGDDDNGDDDNGDDDDEDDDDDDDD